MESTTSPHFLAGKQIIVAGAGIGGVTFCIALQQLLNEKIQPPPSITVYERETSADALGREGYSLSIRGDALSGGMQTLQKLALLDDMLAESNPGTHFTLFNNDFSPLMQIRTPPVEGLPQSTMRIARAKLREILLKNLSSSVAVHWGCVVTDARELDDGGVSVDLADGTQRQCDLLVVADGSNSVIRRSLRPQHVLNFAGAVTIVARTRALDELPAPLNRTWGGVIGGDGHFLFVAPSDRTSALWSVSYLSDTPREAKAADTMTDTEIDAVLEEARQRTKAFSEPMPTLLKETLRSTLAVFNAKDLAPFRNHGAVIFIGDAQHAMSPFAGNGANMAIMDGYQLAEQLVRAPVLPAAVKAYDDLSIPRSTSAIQMSHRSISMGHARGIWKYMWVGVLRTLAWYFGLNYQENQ